MFSVLIPLGRDIIYARLLNKPVIVINSEEVAKDLLEGRSTIYSDKPQSIVYEPLLYIVLMCLMSSRWHLHRRIFHQAFRPAEIPTYHAVQLRSAHKLLFSLLQDPGNYASHFQMPVAIVCYRPLPRLIFNSFVVSYVLPIVYDYEPRAKDDPIVHVMGRYVELIVAALTPGATVFPGATFKRASVECFRAAHDMKDIPLQHVEERMSTGDVASCLVADALNRMKLSEEDVVITTAVNEAASITFAVISFPSGQTSSTLLVFILAMVLNPEAQAKAQAEIDRVVGKDRLPDFDDRPALPYVEAILRETLRWHPALLFGPPRATTTNDIYKGYFIPEGVIVFANGWAMTHNETKYPRPDEFKPERFLHEDGSLTSDTMSLAFGWGRRLCVGRHLADAFLAIFSVHEALDESGKNIPVVPKFSTEPFPCRIVPRFFDASVETLTRLTGLGPSVTWKI
ncbi:cytochrome P450 [Suillus ampliporus]|nr:cytochrome P450 [Suillus ampliporus]